MLPPSAVRGFWMADGVDIRSVHCLTLQESLLRRRWRSRRKKRSCVRVLAFERKGACVARSSAGERVWGQGGENFVKPSAGRGRGARAAQRARRELPWLRAPVRSTRAPVPRDASASVRMLRASSTSTSFLLKRSFLIAAAFIGRSPMYHFGPSFNILLCCALHQAAMTFCV